MTLSMRWTTELLAMMSAWTMLAGLGDPALMVRPPDLRNEYKWVQVRVVR